MASIKQSILLTTAIIIALFLLSSDAFAWYDSNYSYRRQLTIEAGYASGVATTTDAPFVVVVASTTQEFLKDTGQANGRIAQGMGYDIIFVDNDDTTLLDFEYEYYASSTGALVAWIEVPDISSTTDRTIYMYYGNAAATDNSTSGDTWASSKAVGVWHLKETPPTTLVLDSTNNSNNGSTTGSMTASDQVVGQLDGSLDFDGSDDYVDVANESNFDFANMTFTVSAWFKTTQATAGYLIAKGTGGGWLINVNASAANKLGGMIKQTDSNVQRASNSTINDGSWHYFAILFKTDTSNPANQDINIYIDGKIDQGSLITPNYYYGTNNSNVFIGKRSLGSPFNGLIDEVRVYNYARTAEQILSDYQSYFNPNITLTKTVLVNGQAATEAKAGDELTYTITYTVSQAQASNVVITDTIPNGTVYVSGSAQFVGTPPAGATISDTTNTITWIIPSVPVGTSGTVSFKVKVE